MTTRLDVKVPEGSTVGFKIKVYDVNSSVVVPSSMDWYLYDSLNQAVSSGAASSLSSETLITIGSSLTMVNSTEFKPEPKRLLYVDTTYIDDELGTAVNRDIFEFTVVNNPWTP